jgi:8-oxo-dGTP pyrophosphatase MutT (NUDIX family)
MYVTGEIIAEAEAKYGVPEDISMAFDINLHEADVIKGSRINGRSHDVTVFAFRGNELAVIRKHSFPTGAYRAPSGGLRPGEPIDAGAQREFFEETGLVIQLQRYLLRIKARFTCGSRIEDWVTHIFCGSIIGGKLGPIDTQEIEDARYATIEELQGPFRDILLSNGRGLYRYRVALTDATIRKMDELGWPCGLPPGALS